MKAEDFLNQALGGNQNVATLTFFALTELLDAYGKDLKAENAKLKAEMEDWRNKCVRAEEDNCYYRSIFNGSWPTAIETLEATLKALKEPNATKNG